MMQHGFVIIKLLLDEHAFCAATVKVC